MIRDLVAKAQIKFDHHLDPLQLGSQFLRATELLDYPTMAILLDKNLWQDFFVREAKKLRGEVLE